VEQAGAWPVPAFEHPLTPTVDGLLRLERAAGHLDEASQAGSPRSCHLAAQGLGAELAQLAPENLGDSLTREIRRWTDYLDGLAHREGVDAAKLDNLRSLLEQLSRRLATDWPDYFERLSADPWLTAYRQDGGGNSIGFWPAPEAWAVMGETDSRELIAHWAAELAPMRTAAETGLRLMRDSLHREAVSCPPDGHEVELPAEPASGLVRLEGAGGHIPAFTARGPNLVLRFLQPRDLSPATETVQATLGWFTL